MVHLLRSLRHRAREEAGLSLVEVLITVGIMSVAFAAILGALLNGISLSVRHRNMADAQVVMRSFAEHIKGEPFDGTCDPEATYNDPAYVPAAPNNDFTVSVTEVQYWVSATSSFETGCVETGLQSVSLRVTSPDADAEETLVVLKRKP